MVDTLAVPPKGFACLKFSISDPQYYAYNYMGTSGSAGVFTASAYGDLNGDSVTSTFQLAGKLDSSIVLVAPNFIEIQPEQ
jgi:hypothetical protein